jgi:hypothetical protein
MPISATAWRFSFPDPDLFLFEFHGYTADFWYPDTPHLFRTMDPIRCVPARPSDHGIAIVADSRLSRSAAKVESKGARDEPRADRWRPSRSDRRHHKVSTPEIVLDFCMPRFVMSSVLSTIMDNEIIQ